MYLIDVVNKPPLHWSRVSQLPDTCSLSATARPDVTWCVHAHIMGGRMRGKIARLLERHCQNMIEEHEGTTRWPLWLVSDACSDNRFVCSEREDGLFSCVCADLECAWLTDAKYTCPNAPTPIHKNKKIIRQKNKQYIYICYTVRSNCDTGRLEILSKEKAEKASIVVIQLTVFFLWNYLFVKSAVIQI